MINCFINNLIFNALNFSNSLLDAKLTSLLSTCHDQVLLSSVQSIIQNMIACEDTSLQQLHFLQSCGFGGLWRFAGPFTKVGMIFAVLFVILL